MSAPKNVSDQIESQPEIGAAIHFGPALAASIKWSKNLGLVEFEPRVTAMRANSYMSSALTSAHVTQVELGNTVWFKATKQLNLGGDFALSRTSYSNLDQNHYLNSMAIGGLLKYNFDSAIILFHASWAPINQFGYGGKSTFANSGGLNADASNAKVTSEIQIHLDKSVDLKFGVSHQMIAVTINDTSEYQNFGLSGDGVGGPRSYDLSITSAVVGLTRKF
jgi:hypothetical protein